MRELLRETRAFFVFAAVTALCTYGTVAYAQSGQSSGNGQVTEQAVATDAPIQMTPALIDSFLPSVNDSAEVASAVSAAAAKERARFINRVKRSGVGKNYVAGGFFMHFLLACSIIALVIIIERLWTLSRANVNVKILMMKVVRALRDQGPDAALEVCQNTRGPIAAVLHSGLLRAQRGVPDVEKAMETSGSIEMSFLERGLVALATIANVAPLLGFLGTVSGMISAFAAIAAAEQVSAKLVAKGIQEALITTAAGLIIAVPVSIAHSFFVARIDRFIIEMEEASSELVDEMLEIEHERRTAGA